LTIRHLERHRVTPHLANALHILASRYELDMPRELLVDYGGIKFLPKEPFRITSHLVEDVRVLHEGSNDLYEASDVVGGVIPSNVLPSEQDSDITLEAANYWNPGR